MYRRYSLSYIVGLLTNRNSSAVTPISRYIDLSAAFCTFPIVNVGVFDLQSGRNRVRLIRGRRFRILLLYHVRVPVFRLSGGEKLMNLSFALVGGFLKTNDKNIRTRLNIL